MDRSRRSFLAWSGAAAAGITATALGVRALGSGGSSPPDVSGATGAVQVLPPAARTIPEGLTGADLARGLDVPDISPLITPTDRFFRIDVADAVPRIDVDAWRLEITGRVTRPLTLTYEDLRAMPQVSVPITLSCVSNRVGGGLIGTALWQGVELSQLLAMAGVTPDAEQVVGRSVDGFTAGFPTAALDGRPALVAIGMNGAPLPVDHGFPARLVVDGLFGYVSATKWLRSIELTGWEEFDGYWIPRGWAKSAPTIASSRIDTPADQSRVPGGPVTIGGVAWAPPVGVGAVEVRVDDGPWQRAELSESIGDAAWRQWRWEWSATPGRHTISVRTIDRRGQIQDETVRDVLPSGATGLDERSVTVR